MKSALRPSWLAIIVMAALTATCVQLARSSLLPSTHQRLVTRYCERIVALPDLQAARLVSRLAQDDDQWLEVVVAASTDNRPLVAATAESELRERVAHWTKFSSADRSLRAAELAHLLAKTAGTLPSERRTLAHSLAQQLIDWSLDGRVINAAQLIADCEAVLLMPISEPLELRLASAPRTDEVVPTSPEFPPSPPPVLTTPEPPAALAMPALMPPQTEARSPNEPARFAAPGAIRITDD